MKTKSQSNLYNLSAKNPKSFRVCHLELKNRVLTTIFAFFLLFNFSSQTTPGILDGIDSEDKDLIDFLGILSDTESPKLSLDLLLESLGEEFDLDDFVDVEFENGNNEEESSRSVELMSNEEDVNNYEIIVIPDLPDFSKNIAEQNVLSYTSICSCTFEGNPQTFMCDKCTNKKQNLNRTDLNMHKISFSRKLLKELKDLHSGTGVESTTDFFDQIKEFEECSMNDELGREENTTLSSKYDKKFVVITLITEDNNNNEQPKNGSGFICKAIVFKICRISESEELAGDKISERYNCNVSFEQNGGSGLSLSVKYNKPKMPNNMATLEDESCGLPKRSIHSSQKLSLISDSGNPTSLCETEQNSNPKIPSNKEMLSPLKKRYVIKSVKGPNQGYKRRIEREGIPNKRKKLLIAT